MRRYIFLRIVQIVLVMIGVTVLCFFMLKITPGDPATAILGVQASPTEVARVRHALGLDRPWFVQLGIWAENVLHGDLGASYINKKPVSELILTRLPITLELSCFMIPWPSTCKCGCSRPRGHTFLAPTILGVTSCRAWSTAHAFRWRWASSLPLFRPRLACWPGYFGGLVDAVTMLLAALSFLGLGTQPPEPSWGSMLSFGREWMREAPWFSFFPGLAIFVTVLGLNLVGDGWSDALDPRL